MSDYLCRCFKAKQRFGPKTRILEDVIFYKRRRVTTAFLKTSSGDKKRAKRGKRAKEGWKPPPKKRERGGWRRGAILTRSERGWVPPCALSHSSSHSFIPPLLSAPFPPSLSSPFLLPRLCSSFILPDSFWVDTALSPYWGGFPCLMLPNPASLPNGAISRYTWFSVFFSLWLKAFHCVAAHGLCDWPRCLSTVWVGQCLIKRKVWHCGGQNHLSAFKCRANFRQTFEMWQKSCCFWLICQVSIGPFLIVSCRLEMTSMHASREYNNNMQKEETMIDLMTGTQVGLKFYTLRLKCLFHSNVMKDIIHSRNHLKQANAYSFCILLWMYTI